VAEDLKPVYLLTGSDRPKIERALRRLRERFDAESVELLNAADVNGADAVAASNSLGLFGGDIDRHLAVAIATFRQPAIAYT